MKKIIKNHNLLLKDGQNAVLRRLRPNDTVKIADFLSKLSLQTRQFYTLDDYSFKTADALCKSLIKPEKLHLVIENSSGEIIALIKFSLDLPDADSMRFKQYGIDLNPESVCRWGICVADEFQSSGIGKIALEEIVKLASKLGQKVIISSGGIFSQNKRAIQLCEKFGFKIVGEFVDTNNNKHVDMMCEM